jgi:outer membrane lipoprotein carrier protein
MSKNRRLFLLLLFTLLFFSDRVPGVAAQSNGKSVVDNLQKSYDSAADFVADFRQETEIKTLNRSLQARGKLYFKRPGKMLWRYEEPQGQWVLADGKNFYFYQPEQGQIIKSPLKNAFRSDIPLSFLLGLGDLKRDFKAKLQSTEETQYVLQLEPKKESGGLGRILLGIDRRKFDILWARIEDAVGNLTTVRFSDMRKGVGVQDSLFGLQIPEGVDVVEFGS